MEKIEEIYRLFHLREAGKGASGTGSALSTAEKKRLIRMAKEKNIKLPKKGM